jgi:hypothetical protein
MANEVCVTLSGSTPASAIFLCEMSLSQEIDQRRHVFMQKMMKYYSKAMMPEVPAERLVHPATVCPTPSNAMHPCPIFRGISNAFRNNRDRSPFHPMTHVYWNIQTPRTGSYSPYSPSASTSSCSMKPSSSSTSARALGIGPVRLFERPDAALPAAASFATASQASIQSA